MAKGKVLYLKDFQARLSAGKAAGAWVFALGSEEDYREAVTRLKKALVDEAFEPFNYNFFTGREAGAPEIIAAARTRAMGQGGRLVVLREPKGLSKEGLEELAAYLKEPEEGNCLIVVADGFERDDRFVKQAEEEAVLVDFRTPPWVTRREIVGEALRRHGLRADAEALRALEELLPEDRGLMNRELEKVALSLGGRTRIGFEDLKDILVDGRSASVNGLSGHLQRRETAAAVRALDKLLEEGDEPVMLVALLAGRYRQILSAGGPGGGEKKPSSRMPGRAAESLAAAAALYKPEELSAALFGLREVDRLLKSTGVSPRLLLEAFLTGNLPG